MTELLQNLLVGSLIIAGALFTLIASIGLLRLPDFYTRMHAVSKAGILGSGSVLLALALYAHDQPTITRVLAAIVFLLLTAPISAHLLAKAAYTAGHPLWPASVRDELAERQNDRENP